MNTTINIESYDVDVAVPNASSSSWGFEEIPALTAAFERLEQQYREDTGKNAPKELRGIANNFGQHIGCKDFVLDLDIYWPATGISRKDHAVDKLLKMFEGNEKKSFKEVRLRDTLQKRGSFEIESGLSSDAALIPPNKNQTRRERRGGHNLVKYYLTPISLKIFVSNARTPEATLFLQYLVRVEAAFWNIMKDPVTRKRHREEYDSATNELNSVVAEFNDRANRPKIETQHNKARDRIAREIGGMVEVQVFGGRADVCSKSEIVEVKNSKNWIHGVGQLMVYSSQSVNKRLRLHLIGEPCDEAVAFCPANAITLTWEPKCDR
jgi:hypothetical protein